jgi:hypothetical protein
VSLSDEQLAKHADRVLQRLAKWRTLFAGWQLGTRVEPDPEAKAVKDHREVTILLRAEVSALTGLLIRKGEITSRKFTEALADEAEQLDRDYSKRFPGVRSDDAGLVFDPRAIETLRGWKP